MARGCRYGSVDEGGVVPLGVGGLAPNRLSRYGLEPRTIRGVARQAAHVDAAPQLAQQNAPLLLAAAIGTRAAAEGSAHGAPGVHVDARGTRVVRGTERPIAPSSPPAAAVTASAARTLR